MPNVLYNEGRVVGYSAYEIYVKHAISNDPDNAPMTETEWLASMIGMGSSMLLRISTDAIEGPHYRDIPFPENCRLCAASTILASFFSGEGEVTDENPWATKVTDYGPLISNTDNSSPVGETSSGNDIPIVDTTFPTATREKLREYMKISDGIIIQPGTWIENPSPEPAKDFSPILATSPTLRILLSDTITTPFYILLTGFVNRGLISGMSSIDSAVNTLSPQDGDFLGPAVFPWSAKVVFSIPPAYMSYFANSGYSRKLPSSATALSVNSDSIIDMETADPNIYYGSLDNNTCVKVEVTELTTSSDSASVLSLYQQDNKLPPALYGAKVDSTGFTFFCPIDTTAPGTVKLYHGDMESTEVTAPTSRATCLEDSAPQNTGLMRSASSYVVYELDSNTQTDSTNIIPVSDDRTEDINALQVYNTQHIWMYKHNAGGLPNADDLKSVNSFIVCQHLYGYVSDAFVAKYCLDYNYVTNVLHPSGVNFTTQIYDTPTIFFSLYNQLVDKGIADEYVYAVYSILCNHNEPDQQFYLLPIHKDTHLISTIIPIAREIQGMQAGIDFYTADTSGNNRLDFLGSWFNANRITDYDGDPNTASYGIDDIIKNHPIQSVAIKDIPTFYQPESIVPNPERSVYGYDYLSWLKNTNILNMIPTDQWSALGLNVAYQSCTVHEFLMYCATRRMNEEPSNDNSYLPQTAATLRFGTFLIPASNVKSTVSSGLQSGKFVTPLTADVYLHTTMSAYDYFAPQSITFTSIDVDMATQQYDTISDVTNSYVSSSNAIWGAIGQSGNHSTKAISLVDEHGSPLTLVGSADSIPADKLLWVDLLNALNHNKSIDILGEILRGLKSNLSDSGRNYIEFASDDGNPIRLYISRTEPTDSDIPDGSIGIGW